MRRVISSLSIAVLIAAAPASAQAQDKKLSINFGGGYTASLSDVRDWLGDGYNVNVGVIWHLSETVGIQGDYSFTGLGQRRISVPISAAPGGSSVPTDLFGDMNMQYGNLNLMYRPDTGGKAKPYVVAGIGVYYRPITVTTPAVGYMPGFCSPWWYICYPGGFVEVERILGSRSSYDFGMDFGGGIDFAVSDLANVYIEARYHYILGPTITNPSTKTQQKANGQFLPIIFGFRF